MTHSCIARAPILREKRHPDDRVHFLVPRRSVQAERGVAPAGVHDPDRQDATELGRAVFVLVRGYPLHRLPELGHLRRINQSKHAQHGATLRYSLLVR